MQLRIQPYIPLMWPWCHSPELSWQEGIRTGYNTCHTNCIPTYCTEVIHNKEGGKLRGTGKGEESSFWIWKKIRWKISEVEKPHRARRFLSILSDGDETSDIINRKQRERRKVRVSLRKELNAELELDPKMNGEILERTEDKGDIATLLCTCYMVGSSILHILESTNLDFQRPIRM